MIPGKTYTPELILEIAWRRKWWILVPAIVIAISVVAWTRSLTDLYQSDTVILVVPQQVLESYVRSTVTTSVADRLQSISQQILSRTRLERIILDLNLYAAERKTGIMEDIVDAMRGKIGVQIVRGDSFRVSFTSEEPRTAMRVTERLGSLFIDESLRDREVLAEGTSQFLEAQLEDARRQLIDNERRLEEYRRDHNGQLPNQLDANMQGMHNIEMQLQSLLDSLVRDRDRHEALRQTLLDLENNAYIQPPAAAAPPAETAASRLRAAEATLAGLERRLRPTHPDMVRARKSIEELRKAAEEEAATAPVSVEEAPLTATERLRRTRLNDATRELAALEKGIEAKSLEEKRLRDTVTEYQKRIEGTPTRESELIELTRDYGTLQNMYQNLLAKKQESQISANLERRQIGEQFRILDPARLPVRPFTPNRPRFYAMGVLGGLALGLALAGVLEYLDRTMRSEDDVKLALGVPVLATVPFIEIDGGMRLMTKALISVTVTAMLAGGAFVAFRVLAVAMYEQFYGLKERPFDLSPNPRFLFASKRHTEALTHLRYGLSGRPGLTVLIGEAGTGKTTLVRAALQGAASPAQGAGIVCLSNPTLTRAEFYEYLAAGYGFSPEAAQSKPRFLAELEQALASKPEGSVIALVVDEAQSLPHELLEEVRLLTNLQAPSGEALTVALVGQPELAGRLNEERLRQLKQRVALRCELTPLDLQETAAYIATRVRVAGGVPELLFTRDAVATVHEHSKGIPRTISVICDNALVNGFAADLKPLGREAILEVCRDFEFSGKTAESGARTAPPPFVTAAKRPLVRPPLEEPAGEPAAERADDPREDKSMFAGYTRKKRFSIF